MKDSLKKFIDVLYLEKYGIYCDVISHSHEDEKIHPWVRGNEYYRNFHGYTVIINLPISKCFSVFENYEEGLLDFVKDKLRFEIKRNSQYVGVPEESIKHIIYGIPDYYPNLSILEERIRECVSTSIDDLGGDGSDCLSDINIRYNRDWKSYRDMDETQVNNIDNSVTAEVLTRDYIPFLKHGNCFNSDDNSYISFKEVIKSCPDINNMIPSPPVWS